MCRVKSISGTGFLLYTALEMWPSIVTEGGALGAGRWARLDSRRERYGELESIEKTARKNCSSPMDYIATCSGGAGG